MTITDPAASVAFMPRLSGRVLLLEDEPKVVGRLERALLEAAPGLQIAIERTQEDAMRAVRTAEAFDAVSVDWEFNRFMVGADILKCARVADPDTTKIVYTQYAEFKTKALSAGADEFVHKGDEERAVRTLVDGIKLTACRRLRREIAGMRGIESSQSRVVGQAEAEELYKASRAILIETYISSSPHDGRRLRRLLRVVGMWQEFSMTVFLSLEPLEKVRAILHLVHCAPEELAGMVEVDLPSARRFLETSDAGVFKDLKTLECANDLLSVLSFVLGIAQYEPDVALAQWTRRGDDKASPDAPPWRGNSMREYLCARGRAGVSESVTWIRNH